MEYQNILNDKIKKAFEGNKQKDCVADTKDICADTRKKVLIIDDEKLLHDMYCAKFSKNGFNSKAVSCGDDAIKTIKGGFIPDIMMIDLMMPNTDGFTVFKSIKKEKLAPKAIAIMLTNKGLTEEIDKAKELGFNGFIIKALTVPQEVVDRAKQIYLENCK